MTLVAAPTEGSDTAVIGFIVQPLIAWLWIGGAVMAFGTALALSSGRRGPVIDEPRPAASAQDDTVPVSLVSS